MVAIRYITHIMLPVNLHHILLFLNDLLACCFHVVLLCLDICSWACWMFSLHI